MYRSTVGRRGILAVALCTAWAVVGRTDGEAGFGPRFPDRGSFERFVREGVASPFGLDYVFIHSPGARERELVDGFCSRVGIRWVNLTRLEWKLVERRAPRAGRHSYNWVDVDAAVRTWQRNGIHIMVSMRFESPWATRPRTDAEFVYLKGLAKHVALRGADDLPKPEHMADLRAYMRAVVERYDGDGIDDMPGLRFPVLHYQVGNEYHNEVFWAGSAQDYCTLLRTTAQGARQANPDVKVILSGIGFAGVPGFYATSMGSRTRAYVQRLLPQVPAGMREFVERSEAFSRASVACTDAYDILDARWPNYGTVAGGRAWLRAAGAPETPVWSAEIYSGFPLMEPLVLPNWTLQAWPTPSRSGDYLKILKRKAHAKFEEINEWYRSLQAAHVVKLCMVALDAGSQKLMMGWAVDAQHPLAVSTLSHHGLYSATFKQLWPAARTYDLVTRKLAGVHHVRRLAAPPDVYLYACRCRSGRTVIVAFHDDHIGQNHDEPTGTLAVDVPLPWTRVRVTHTITRIGQVEPVTRNADVTGGVLRMTLTEYPVFIEGM